MNEAESCRQIAEYIRQRESQRQLKILEDPSSFLKELKEYTAEPSDEVFDSIIRSPHYATKIWNGIDLLARLRKKSDSRWEDCRPVLTDFFKRAKSLEPFRGDIFFQRYEVEIFGDELQEAKECQLSLI